MPAKRKDGIIALETEKFENKISEFQLYLEINNINKISEFDEDPSKKYKEIDVQLKMLLALPILLEGLKKLKEKEADKKVETYGDVEVNAAWKILKEK